MLRFASAAAALALAGCAAGASAQVPASWTTFRLNPQLNAVVSANVTPRWTVQTNGPTSASPTVANGTVYLGTNRDTLYAIDLATGRVRWTARAQSPLMSAPLVVDGLVIVGEGDANSTTYVPRREVVVGAGPSALIAFDARTGARRWTVPLGGSAMPTPAIVNGTLVQHNGAGGIIGLDPDTGAVRWRSVPKSIASMAGALPIGNGLVVTAGIYPNRVFAFRASDGRTVWSYPLSPGDTGIGDCPPASDGRRVFGDYVAPRQAGGESGVGVDAVERVYGLDAATGRPLWNVALEDGVVPPRNEAAIPLVYRGSLFLGSAIAPYVHALDPATGRERWRLKVGGPVKGGMVGVGGTVYFGDLSGTLWAVDAATGRVLGRLRTGTPYNVGSPVAVGGSLLIGSKTGAVEAVPLAAIRGGTG